MSCRICGRGACTESFHSIEDQERFEKREEMSDDINTLRRQLQDAQDEIEELKKKLEESAQ